VVTILGVFVILGSLALELVPRSSPGIGPLQILMIVCGCMLILVSLVLISWRMLAISLPLGFLAFLLLLEIVLRSIGHGINYPPDVLAQSQEPLPRNDLYICDSEIGCRINPNLDPSLRFCDELDEGTSRSRFCRINVQGFQGDVDFTPENAPRDEYRILALGDSFTWGGNAQIGNSWLETMEARLEANGQPVTVWNAAIAATGTRQALVNARQLVPIMRPDVVLLGFLPGNDFIDNLYPLDTRVDLLVNEKYILVHRYFLDRDLNPLRLSDQSVYFRAVGKPAALNSLQVLLGQTSLGSIFVNALNNLSAADMRSPSPAIVARTEAPLAELRDFLADSGVPLIVVNIPSHIDYPQPSEWRLAFQSLSQALGLSVIEVYDVVNGDLYLPHPDNHWGDEGHILAGERVAACLEPFIRGEALCAGQTAP
jgi:hypothetical protein